MSKAKYIILLLLLLASCEDREEILKVTYAQGYLDGAQHCIDKITRKPSRFELWQGSGIYNKYDNIYDARKALEDCTGKQLLELTTHVDVEQYLHLCNQHETLRKTS